MANQGFDKKFLDTQKKLLLDHKMRILNLVRSNADLAVEADQVVEDGDQAQTYIDQNLSFGLRELEIHQLHEIEEALSRINNGSYGICEETGEPIGKKRLEKVPWTRLSLEAQEDIEREQGFARAS